MPAKNLVVKHGVVFTVALNRLYAHLIVFRIRKATQRLPHHFGQKPVQPELTCRRPVYPHRQLTPHFLVSDKGQQQIMFFLLQLNHAQVIVFLDTADTV